MAYKTTGAPRVSFLSVSFPSEPQNQSYFAQFARYDARYANFLPGPGFFAELSYGFAICDPFDTSQLEYFKKNNGNV